MKLIMTIMFGFFLFVISDVSTTDTYYMTKNGITYQYPTFMSKIKNCDPIDSTYNILTDDEILACKGDPRLFKSFK